MLESITKVKGCQYPVGLATDRGTGEQFRVACGRWSCDICGPRRVRRVRRRLREKSFTKFITLTSPGSTIAEQSAAINRFCGSLRRGWRDRGRRHRTGMSSYFWAREVGVNGVLHLHMLVDMRYLHQRSLSRLAVRSGFGRVVDIRSLRGVKIAGYVTKYATKNLAGQFPRSTRRFQFNRRQFPAAELSLSGLWRREQAWVVELETRGRAALRASSFVHSLYSRNHSCCCRECLESRWLAGPGDRVENAYDPLGARSQRVLNLIYKRKTQQISMRWRDPGG